MPGIIFLVSVRKNAVILATFHRLVNLLAKAALAYLCLDSSDDDTMHGVRFINKCDGGKRQRGPADQEESCPFIVVPSHSDARFHSSEKCAAFDKRGSWQSL